jgi:hypothetical protein
VQVPHGFRPARGYDIICVDTPSGKVAKMSSSYDLPIFSSGADPEGLEIVAAASRGSSPSIGELWPDIDKLDEIRRIPLLYILTMFWFMVGNRSHRPRRLVDVLSAKVTRPC